MRLSRKSSQHSVQHLVNIHFMLTVMVVVVVKMREIRKKKSELRKREQKGNNLVSTEGLLYALGTYQLPSPFIFPLTLLSNFMRWVVLPHFTDGETKAQRVKTATHLQIAKAGFKVCVIRKFLPSSEEEIQKRVMTSSREPPGQTQTTQIWALDPGSSEGAVGWEEVV